MFRWQAKRAQASDLSSCCFLLPKHIENPEAFGLGGESIDSLLASALVARGFRNLTQYADTGLARSLTDASFDPAVGGAIAIRDSDSLSQLASMAASSILLLFSDLRISGGTRAALQSDPNRGTKSPEESHISMQVFAAFWDAANDSVVWQGSLQWSASTTDAKPTRKTAEYLTAWLSFAAQANFYQAMQPEIRN